MPETTLNTLLGLVVSALVTILLFQMRGQRKDSKAIGEKLDAHILEITKALALKVDINACKNTRSECIGLNHKIIRDPLQAQISDVNRKRRERWITQADENRQLWSAIRHHSHTGIEDHEKDRVVLKGGE